MGVSAEHKRAAVEVSGKFTNKPRTNSVCFWEAPRSFGTAISFGFYNGLRQQGIKAEFVDEPFSHYHVTSVFDKGGQKAVDLYHHSHMNPLPLDEGGYIVQKEVARRLFDVRGRLDIEQVGWSWLENFQHVFLIRDPKECLASYSEVRRNNYSGRTSYAGQLAFQGDEWKKKNPLGFDRLLEVFQRVNEIKGERPLVVDTTKLLLMPTEGMASLSDHLGVEYNSAMVQWNAVDISPVPWADKWYKTLLNSTGLIKYSSRHIELNHSEQEIVTEQMPYYEALMSFSADLD